ncbi:hypothetical protein LINGRAPRIM_LOCUS3341 [Linum grandiflorum]
MRILAWNVQGLGSAWTSDSLQTLWRQTHPSIMFLSETKNHEVRVKKKLNSQLKLNNYIFVNPRGRSGGLVMAWISTLVGTVLMTNPYCITVEFCLPNDIIFTVVGVYISCDIRDRTDQLSSISQFCAQIKNPFVIYGDFNSILSYSEKVSSFDISLDNVKRSIDVFQQFVSDLALTDITPSAPLFTWTNRQAREVKCRLDRFLFSPNWFNLCPQSVVHHLSDNVSDHGAILLSNSINQHGPKKYFSFDHRWLANSEAISIGVLAKP